MSFLFKKICIASDHAGYDLKENIKNHLVNKNVSIFDLGPYEDKSVDFNVYHAHVYVCIGGPDSGCPPDPLTLHIGSHSHA